MTTQTRNKKFARMTKAQKRVEIAKDALKQLRANQYKAATDGYFTLAKSAVNTLEFGVRLKLSHVIKHNPKNCHVCLRAAVLLSTFRKFKPTAMADCQAYFTRYDNSLCMDDVDTAKVEKQFFTVHQTQLMETAFEQRELYSGPTYNIDSPLTSEDVKAAEAFGKRYRSPKTRMIAILSNVVRNKGKFVIPKD